MQYGIRHYNPLIIEVCIIDEMKIYKYGGDSVLDQDRTKEIKVDKDILLEMFKVNGFSKIDIIKQIIDDIYDNMEICLEEDERKMMNFFSNR
jgi:hypothetical protein